MLYFYAYLKSLDWCLQDYALKLVISNLVIRSLIKLDILYCIRVHVRITIVFAFPFWIDFSSILVESERECITNFNANTLMDTQYYKSTELIQNAKANAILIRTQTP